MKSLLDTMALADMAYVEAAAYPAGKKHHRAALAVTAACLALTLLGGIAYAADAFDAVRAYFTPQNETAEALLQAGTLTTQADGMTMRVDNCIADRSAFVFTLSLSGLDKKLPVGGSLNTVWITKDGARVTDFDREYGAYTEGKGWREEFIAHARSLYDDADATFLVINRVPAGYTIDELQAVEVSCRELTLRVAVGDTVAETYTLSPADGTGTVTDFTASAIGFRFTAAEEAFDLRLIRADGTYFGDGSEGWNGFWASTSHSGDGPYTVYGRWGGEGDIAIGILDLSGYIGIQMDGVDYYFDR